MKKGGCLNKVFLMIFVKDLLIMKIGCLNIFLMRFVLGYGMIWLIIMFVMFEKGYIDLNI